MSKIILDAPVLLELESIDEEINEIISLLNNFKIALGEEKQISKKLKAINYGESLLVCKN